MLDIKKTAENGRVTLSLSGRLDTVTAPELEKELGGVYGCAEELIFDFTGLEYISSAGLRILLSAKKKMPADGMMKITGVNEMVGEIFDLTGFSAIFTTERAEAGA